MENLSSFDDFLFESGFDIELSLAQLNINKERDLNQKMNDLREKLRKADEDGNIHLIKKLRLMMQATKLQKTLNDINFQLKELAEIEKRKKK
jgi:hypothetical protein